jgi:hypothetical protein
MKPNRDTRFDIRQLGNRSKTRQKIKLNQTESNQSAPPNQSESNLIKVNQG